MNANTREAIKASAELAWHVEDVKYFAEQLEQSIGTERFPYEWRDFIEFVDGFIEPSVGKLFTAIEVEDDDSPRVPASIH